MMMITVCVRNGVATTMTTDNDTTRRLLARQKELLHTFWIGLNEFGDGNGADDGAHCSPTR